MAKKAKKPVNEVIPDGMQKKDYADAAFKKKVTIINACILLAFFIGVCAVIGVGWYKTEQSNKLIEQQEQAFLAEAQSVKDALAKIDAQGGSYDDRAEVVIEVTDDNFYYWIQALDASYSCDSESEDYAAYGGATIHLQGMFYTKKFEGYDVENYWVYRNHLHEGAEHNHEHSHQDAGEMIPIEVIFSDDAEIPADGTWVDVKGVVGPDSTKNLSGIRYAEMTVMDNAGNEYVE